MNYIYPDTRLLIDGRWCDGAGEKTIDVINPATGAKIGKVAQAERQDLERVTRSIAKGFELWSRLAPFERAVIMHRAAGLLRERADEIAWIMTCEQGKPLKQSHEETVEAADTIEWFAEEGKRAYGKIIPSRHENVVQWTALLPVGPVAAFTPWNFPINQVVRKLCGALAAGCSIVVKPPEETPASPAALIQAFIDAGVPAGVMAVVYGVPAEISEFFIPHPVIEKISFTGSTAVGKLLAGLAGRHMKKSTMELGGHAPVLVFDDADIEQAVSTIVQMKCLNCGQVCTSPTRILVQDKVFDAFLEGYIAETEKIRVGNGLEKAVDMGPLANDRRIPALEAMISDAVSKGGTLHCGGRRIGDAGYFFEPTVLSHVPADARIMNEEPFGPVVVINRFSTTEEAVAEANRLRYGLASYVFTRSAKNVHFMGMQINAGMTAFNHDGLALPEVPFGGIKDSGYGTEGGIDAVRGYLESKFLTLAVG